MHGCSGIRSICRAFAEMPFSTLLYFANWHFIFTGQGYFAQSTAPSPLLHMWSLAGRGASTTSSGPIVAFFVLRRGGTHLLAWVAGPGRSGFGPSHGDYVFWQVSAIIGLSRDRHPSAGASGRRLLAQWAFAKRVEGIPAEWASSRRGPWKNIRNHARDLWRRSLVW